MAEELGPEPIEILLVEDNADDAALFEESLRGSPLLRLASIVGNGEQALEYLRREGAFHRSPRPGLVLLDINLPGQSGFEILSAMKADASLSSIPVVMLTGSQRDEDIARSYESGACSFLAKPGGIEKIREVLDQFAHYWSLVAVLPPHRQSVA